MDNNDRNKPVTAADLDAFGQKLEAKLQTVLDEQTKTLAHEFRVALEQSESHLRGAKADQLSMLEGDVRRLKARVFGEAH